MGSEAYCAGGDLVFSQGLIPPKELAMSIQMPTDQAVSGDAHILILRDGTDRFLKSSRLGASLSYLSVIMEDAGSLTAEYAKTLVPSDRPYVFEFPRDGSHGGNIDYRDEKGVYFIMPVSGRFVVFCKTAEAPNRYEICMTYINLRFEHGDQVVTINGTAQATF